MINPKLIKSDPEFVVSKLASRGFHFLMEEYNRLETSRKLIQTNMESLQAEKNRISKLFAKYPEARKIMINMGCTKDEIEDMIQCIKEDEGK